MKKASDLIIGDYVDLEGDKYAGYDPLFEYEYVEVVSIDRETSNCIAIGFEGFDIVGFPPDHLVKVRK